MKISRGVAIRHSLIANDIAGEEPVYGRRRGETPVMRLNAVAKCCADEKP